MLDEETIEKLAIKHEAFGFGLVDEKGVTAHGFSPEGLQAFAKELAELAVNDAYARDAEVMTRVKELDESIKKSIERFRVSDVSDLDPDLLELARQVVAKNKLVPSNSPKPIAKSAVSNRPDDITAKILKIVRENVPTASYSKVELASRFVADLEMDSLDQVELLMCVEDEFNFELTDEEYYSCKSVQELVDLVLRVLDLKNR